MVSRPHWSTRLRLVIPGIVVLAMGVLGAVKGNHLAWVLVAVGLFGLSELWRSVRVRDGRLVAQGRIVRRTVALTELTAIGVSPVHRVWVGAASRRPFYLRMVNDLGAAASNPTPSPFAEGLDRLARQAGADLAGQAPQDGFPPRGTRPFFSA
ncbi:hypothetical protein [Ornithinimicrobium cavernae]|uniref:hypothetical protein n=1 Tax=Ornithinimicrobium cavernae TaxID=2666047 RepID=UPI0012B177D3|nr:hypothetical protein [Ornithinimicrobium cavernae]